MSKAKQNVKEAEKLLKKLYDPMRKIRRVKPKKRASMGPRG